MVLIGDRQDGREHGENLTAVDPVADQIKSVFGDEQLENGRHEPGALYGDGNASARIIEKTKRLCALFSKKRSITGINKGILIIEPKRLLTSSNKDLFIHRPCLVLESINSIPKMLDVLW